MGKREDGKADRRQRIIIAARDLIRETGDAGLSMRAIAARAGVSLSTPYNLFGSKRAIVLALLEDVREFNERYSRLHPEPAIDRIFQVVTMSISYYLEDPDFYRALWNGALDMSGKEMRAALNTPERRAFWRGLLDEAAEEGDLLESLDIELVQLNLDMIYVSAMLAWLYGALQVDQLEPAIGHGYALALRGAATEQAQAKLERRVVEYQKRLKRPKRRVGAVKAAVA